MMYVCFLLNNTASHTRNNAVPIQVATGSTNDISALLCFHWFQAVYYKIDDSDFPSDSREGKGRFVGISEHVGHALTFRILTDDTKRVIHRSNVRPADDPKDFNLRADLLLPYDRPVKQFVKGQHYAELPLDHGEESTTPSMPTFNAEDIVGRTFLLPQEDGERHRARIIKVIDDHNSNLANDSKRIKFL